MSHTEPAGVLRVYLRNWRWYRASALIVSLAASGDVIWTATGRSWTSSRASEFFYYILMAVVILGTFRLYVRANSVAFHLRLDIARAQDGQPAGPIPDATKTRWAVILTFVGVVITAVSIVLAAKK